MKKKKTKDEEPKEEPVKEKCDHGITFDAEAARALLASGTVTNFILGNDQAPEVRRCWPRLNGKCPKGCGYEGIAYASTEHYVAGDW